MTARRALALALALLLALTALTAGIAAAQGPTEPAPAGIEPATTLAAVGTAFTYQGRLKDSGVPAAGVYDFQFRLYDALSGGSQIGGTSSVADVAVSDGLFTVTLDFGASAFDGQARWLEIDVKRDADGSYTTLSPRQALTAAPYALSLRPGAAVDGSTGDTILTLSGGDVGLSARGLDYGVYGEGVGADSYGVHGFSSAVGLSAGVAGRSDSVTGNGVYGAALHISGSTRAVYGLNLSTAGTGVLGSASAGSGTTYGVRGESASGTGYGVHGIASAISGANYGVYGRSYSTSGAGVYGYASQSSGTTYGVYGQSSSTDGRGVVGLAAATSGSTRGVIGTSNSSDGTGVLGLTLASSGQTNGVRGESASPDGRGVYGLASSGSGATYGVYGRSASTAGVGVYGQNSSTGGYGGKFDGYGTDVVYVENLGTGRGIQAYAPSDTAIWGKTDSGLAGVDGRNTSETGRGVYGYASHSSGSNYGVFGRTASTAGDGVYGEATAASGATSGVYGLSASSGGAGVYGYANASSGSNVGMYGRSDSTSGTGVYGYATASSGGAYGVYGSSASTSGRGVYGYATASSGSTNGVYGRSASSSGNGVYGTNSGGGRAGYFSGNVHVNGTLTKSSGAFKIDHPLDPANQYLSHSFVESPDMKNIYDGVAALDANGEATVTLPEWFEALNRDFRYQLTPVGAAMPNLYIAQEIQANQFRIAGGAPGMKVSWQVTGIRQDAYANAHRIPVEEPKPAEERGTYLHPTELGQPAEVGLDYQREAQFDQTQEAVPAGDGE